MMGACTGVWGSLFLSGWDMIFPVFSLLLNDPKTNTKIKNTSSILEEKNTIPVLRMEETLRHKWSI